ncbi:STAS domain-containing protein [Virgibacillus kimchii]
MYKEEDKVQKEIALISNRVKELKQAFTEKIASGFNRNELVSSSIHEFIDILMERFHDTNEEKMMEKAIAYGKETGEMVLKHGNKLDDSINSISIIRREMWHEIKEIMLDEKVSLEAALKIADDFDPLFDKVIFAFSTAYIEAYNKNLQQAEDEFLKLSAPIVTIMEQVAILPIIGGMDEKRAELLMDKALKEAVDRNLNKLFIDLSGVTLIDTMVAYHIYKIVQALDLVGVSTVLVGIRPEVTQTMVSLGVEFSDVKTFGSLHQALSKNMLVN